MTYSTCPYCHNNYKLREAVGFSYSLSDGNVIMILPRHRRKIGNPFAPARREDCPKSYHIVKPAEASPLTAENKQVVDDYQDIGKELGNALDKIDLLRAALEAVEWTYSGDRDNPAWCPSCWGYKGDGHEPDCQRQIALGLTEEASDDDDDLDRKIATMTKEERLAAIRAMAGTGFDNGDADNTEAADLETAQAENMRLTQENEGLVGVIESVEWMHAGDYDICPSCLSTASVEWLGPGDPHVHKPGCRIEAALRPVAK